MTQPSREQRQRWGRIGGLSLRARRDPAEYTKRARDAFLDSFLAAQPADLPADERERRAVAAKRAHMLRLAEKSAKARRERGRA